MTLYNFLTSNLNLEEIEYINASIFQNIDSDTGLIQYTASLSIFHKNGKFKIFSGLNSNARDFKRGMCITNAITGQNDFHSEELKFHHDIVMSKHREFRKIGLKQKETLFGPSKFYIPEIKKSKIPKETLYFYSCLAFINQEEETWNLIFFVDDLQINIELEMLDIPKKTNNSQGSIIAEFDESFKKANDTPKVFVRKNLGDIKNV